MSQFLLNFSLQTITIPRYLKWSSIGVIPHSFSRSLYVRTIRFVASSVQSPVQKLATDVYLAKRDLHEGGIVQLSWLKCVKSTLIKGVFDCVLKT